MTQKRLYKSIFRMSTVITVGFTLGAFLGIATPKAHALEYTDYSLGLKDYDQMESLIWKRKRQSTGIDDPDLSRHVKARDSLFVVLSRCDRDGTRESLVKLVQSDFDDDFYSTVSEIGEQALKYVGDSKVSIEERSTYLQVLQNIVLEFRPQAKTKLKDLFEKIRDAKIDPDHEVVQYRFVKMDEGAVSPSKMAEVALK